MIWPQHLTMLDLDDVGLRDTDIACFCSLQNHISHDETQILMENEARIVLYQVSRTTGAEAALHMGLMLPAA
jgi:hypothetical protein